MPKTGDCLHTADEESKVAKVERRLAEPNDLTCTVELEGAHDLPVLSSAVAHAKPQGAIAAEKVKSKVAAAAMKYVHMASKSTKAI
jgi:hypothetical protein